MKYLVVLGLLLFTACAGRQRPVPQPVAIPWVANCAIEFRDTIRAAFGYWNSVQTAVEFYEADCWSAPSPRVDVFYNAFGSPAYAALTYAQGTERPTIALHREWYLLKPLERETLVRHEIGHVMGLDNSNAGNCLMFSRINPAASHPVKLCPWERRQIKFEIRYEPLRPR